MVDPAHVPALLGTALVLAFIILASSAARLAGRFLRRRSHRRTVSEVSPDWDELFADTAAPDITPLSAMRRRDRTKEPEPREITRAAKLPEAELARLRSLLTGASGPPPVPTENKAPCPACPGSLSEVVLGAVHVDYCGSCHGLFLDRGELEEAIEAVRARDRNTSARQVVAAAASGADLGRR